MRRRPQKNPQAWGRKLKEFRESVGRKRGVKVSLGMLSVDLSRLSAHLTDKEAEGLRSLGAATYLGLSTETLSRYESGGRSPDLGGIFFLIYYFTKYGVIELEEANQWLAMAGEEPLYPDESRFLFGQVTGPGELLTTSEEIIPVRKYQDSNTFIIPNEHIPEHHGYAVFKGPQGLIIKLITVSLLVIGMTAISMYRQVIVERLKKLDFITFPTPTRIEPTPFATATLTSPTTPTMELPPSPQPSTPPPATPTSPMPPAPLPAPSFPPVLAIKPEEGQVLSANEAEINFEWENIIDTSAGDSTGSVQYELHLENIDLGIDSPSLQQDYRTITTTNFTLPMLVIKGLYRWRVRPVFVFDDTKIPENSVYMDKEVPSEWNEWQTFSVGE